MSAAAAYDDSGAAAAAAHDADAGADDATVEVRRIQPYQARKNYLCGGCHNTIPPGVGHVVVVPQEAADLRRHWHHSCWQRRHHLHSR